MADHASDYATGDLSQRHGRLLLLMEPATDNAAHHAAKDRGYPE
jgi:hypothetical protein